MWGGQTARVVRLPARCRPVGEAGWRARSLGVPVAMRVPPAWPAALVTFLASVICFAVLGLALVSVVRSAQAVIGVALGTLLPLSFISDVFVVGAAFPPALDMIAWVFPLRHATRAMTEATDAGVVGSGFAPGHLGMLLVWTLAGLAVVAWRFSWVPRDGAVRRPAAARRRRPAR